MDYIETLKNFRNDADIKQYEIAEEIGVSPKTYSMYENNYRNIPIEKLDKLITKFNISLDYILDLSQEINYPNLKKINYNRYAENLREIRKNLNLSQNEMAKSIKCSQQSLSEYENGNIVMPLEILKLLCIKSNLSADYITGKTRKKIKLDRNKK